MSDSPAPGVDGVNALSQKMAEATRFTIISLDIHLADLKLSLRVRMKRSISGTCLFLDAQFRFMPREVMSLRSG